jgi:hypothetical protein
MFGFGDFSYMGKIERMFTRISLAFIMGTLISFLLGLSIMAVLCLVNLHSYVSFAIEQIIGYTVIIGSIIFGYGISILTAITDYMEEKSHRPMTKEEWTEQSKNIASFIKSKLIEAEFYNKLNKRV